VVAGAGDLDAAHDLIRRAREEHENLRALHPLGIDDILIAVGACALLEGRTDVAARLLAAAGPTAGFRPISAVLVHYARAAGPPASDEGIPDPTDTVGLENLVDAEFVRWARERSSAGAADAAPPSRSALEV
jgi:hypothetical protein